MFALATTTIGRLDFLEKFRANFEQFARLSDICVIVIGDKNSPPECIDDV